MGTKVKILTHRLGSNYGGIIQAYALQKYIQNRFKNIESVRTGNMHPDHSHLRRLISTVGGSIKRRQLFINTAAINDFLLKNTYTFISKNMQTMDFDKDIPNAQSDIYIVGSDQVWRASYMDPIKYMFDWIKDDRVKRLSYAASFGTDNVSEYTYSQLTETARLAKSFSGVSVREASGVSIVKKYWNVDASCHVDPAMLLDARDYSVLIDSCDLKGTPKGVFVYVLDRSAVNNEIINRVEKDIGFASFEVLPKKYDSYLEFLRDKESYVMPPIQQWLKSFRDSEFVITDSFHGCVFSILFNKPFIAIANKERGIARFSSLLELFGLHDRLVSSPESVSSKLFTEDINWAPVNEILDRERKRSFEYLNQHLKELK